MLRLLADENINQDLVRGVLRRRPGLELVRVQAVGLSQAEDPDVLAWAAREERVLLTHDVNTMIHFAIERIRRGEPMAGVFVIRQEGAALSRLIDDLLLLDECSDTSEWTNQILYLPLR
jgi:predicted nuclease of predicted toxin-antitoxin system